MNSFVGLCRSLSLAVAVADVYKKMRVTFFFKSGYCPVRGWHTFFYLGREIIDDQHRNQNVKNKDHQGLDV